MEFETYISILVPSELDDDGVADGGLLAVAALGRSAWKCLSQYT